MLLLQHLFEDSLIAMRAVSLVLILWLAQASVAQDIQPTNLYKPVPFLNLGPTIKGPADSEKAFRIGLVDPTTEGPGFDDDEDEYYIEDIDSSDNAAAPVEQTAKSAADPSGVLHFGEKQVSFPTEDTKERESDGLPQTDVGGNDDLQSLLVPKKRIKEDFMNEDDIDAKLQHGIEEFIGELKTVLNILYQFNDFAKTSQEEMLQKINKAKEYQRDFEAWLWDVEHNLDIKHGRP